MNNLFADEEYTRLKTEFSAYYEEKLKPCLRESEKSRYVYLAAFMGLIILGVLFYPAILKIILTSQNNENDAVIGFTLAASCVVIMLLCGPLFRYRKKVKPQIMPFFADFFGSFSYMFGGKIDDSILKQSDLFSEYNKNTGDDYFSGSYDGVKITVAEEKLEQSKKDFRGFDVNKKIFRGICILLEMNKNFQGRTVVLEDKGWRNIFSKINGLQNIKLEDLRFEKYFEVYSSDQIEARYLLTTAFMERIIKLRDLYEGSAIQLCFSNNSLLISIPTKQDMFEAHSFFGSNVNKERIDLVFDQFYTIFSIIKLLKLNQRTGL